MADSEIYLASDARHPGSLPRFTVEDGGRWINDDDFIFDAALKISGNFSDEQRLKFAQWVCDVLNEADKSLPREPRATPPQPGDSGRGDGGGRPNAEVTGGHGLPWTSG